MRKKLLIRTALGIGSFNLAYAAETEDTSSGKKNKCYGKLLSYV